MRWPRSVGCSTWASRVRAATWRCRGQQQRPSATGKLQRRKPSRFLRALGAGGGGHAAAAGVGDGTRITREPGAARARLGADDAVLFDALRAWRLERARADKVSPFIVAYDTVIAEIAERRPQSDGRTAGHPRHRSRQGGEVRRGDPRHRGWRVARAGPAGAATSGPRGVRRRANATAAEDADAASATSPAGHGSAAYVRTIQSGWALRS